MLDRKFQVQAVSPGPGSFPGRTSSPSGWRWMLPMAVLALVSSGAGVALAGAPGAGGNRTGSAPGISPDATTPTGNISISTTLPATTIPGGSDLEAGYAFHIVSFPSGHAAIKFHIPGIQFSFPEGNGGKVTLWVIPQNFTVKGTHWIGGNSTHASKVLGSNATSFVAGSNATMSSELLAVMNTVRWGTVQIDVQWSWSVRSTSGSNTTGISPVHTIQPQEYVHVASAGPSTLKPGQNYTVCLSGPYIGARTLSLHMEVPSPYQAIAWSNTKIPANSTHWCWSVQVPTSFHKVPSPLIVHIWSYATRPGILYVLHTQAV